MILTTHGGDWNGFRLEFGREPLDFSANVSPLGVPDGVLQAAAEALSQADRYPDPLCRELTEKLAETEQVPQESVLCGAGAADLLWRTVRAVSPEKALVPVPSFAEYETALNGVSCQTDWYPLTHPSYLLGDDFTDRIPKGGLVILCQPNNPTGTLFPLEQVIRTAEVCRERKTVLVVDECFLDFVEGPERYAFPLDFMTDPNVLVLKAFTKRYGMAGFRLGYVMGHPALLEKIRKAGPPWSVSNIAQAAGIAALSDPAYGERVRDLISRERPYLYHGLRDLGLDVVKGEANFLLFRCEEPLLAPLYERGILLRGCGNFRGLDDMWYRTAVRTQEENKLLLQALSEVLAR